MTHRHHRADRDMRALRERKYRLRARTSKFIPAADSDFAQMARHFAEHVAAHAQRFSFSTKQVEELGGAVGGFREALAWTLRPDSAGPMATSRKKTTRAQAELLIRAAARILRADESLTDDDRISLNLRQRPQRLQQRECPQVAPILKFRGSTSPGAGVRGVVGGEGGGRHILEFMNDFDRASGAKPHGAARLELFVELVPPEMAAEGRVPAHPAQLSGGRLWYLRSFTTRRFEVEFPVMEDGTPMLVVYWGRWADAKGGVGPFSRPCAAQIEGWRSSAVAARALPGRGDAGRRAVRVMPPRLLPAGASECVGRNIGGQCLIVAMPHAGTVMGGAAEEFAEPSTSLLE